MTFLLGIALAAIAVVLVFDCTNGFHDAANIIATVIASRAMTPAQAVLVVGFFEFLGPLLGGTAVANTIASFVDLNHVDPAAAIVIVLCGLFGAIVWNIVTWWKGIPSSSSHALVGGLIGAVVVAAGVDHVVWGFHDLVADGHLRGVTKVLVALAVSPLLGFWVAFSLHRLTSRLLARARPSINLDLRRAQFFTTAWLAFSHGANDGQKSMGIMTMVLLLGGFTVERPGSGETLNRGVYDFMKPYGVNFFASMRVVTDFAGPDKIAAVIAGGVNERHFQPHQNDQAKLLVANERRSWWFNPVKAEANAKSALQLVP